MKTPIEDPTLLWKGKIALLEGDTFSQVFHVYYNRLCLFTQRFISDWEDVEDIVGEVFSGLWGKELVFDNPNHLLAYLYQSIRHAVVNFKLKKTSSESRNRKYAQQFSDMSEANYLTTIAYTEGISALYREINKLPARARQIVILYFIEGKSNAEIAHEMNISLQTVKNQKNRALGILRNHLSQEQLQILFLYYLSQNLIKF